MIYRPPLKLAEFFAGIGGFRAAFTGDPRFGLTPTGIQHVYSNEWDPSSRTQWPSRIYREIWGDRNHDNRDILDVSSCDIPDADIWTISAPCQPFSVANSNAEGMRDKKGQLMLHILDLAEQKRPQYLVIENVDALLKMPRDGGGKDFLRLLMALRSVGYIAEWRVVDSAEYGSPQSRRRLFVVAVHKSSAIWQDTGAANVLYDAFPRNMGMDRLPMQVPHYYYDELLSGLRGVDFDGYGTFNDGLIESWALDSEKPSTYGKATLGDVIGAGGDPDLFYLNSFRRWDESRMAHMKAAKSEERTSPDGFDYEYSEGALPFPDPLDRPARTVVRKEGSIDRKAHVIRDPVTDRNRLLTHEEVEALFGFFPRATNAAPDKTRYALMGNSLVVPTAHRIALSLLKKSRAACSIAEFAAAEGGR